MNITNQLSEARESVEKINELVNIAELNRALKDLMDMMIGAKTPEEKFTSYYEFISRLSSNYNF